MIPLAFCTLDDSERTADILWKQLIYSICLKLTCKWSRCFNWKICLFSTTPNSFENEWPANRVCKNVATQTETHTHQHAATAFAQIQINTGRVCARGHTKPRVNLQTQTLSIQWETYFKSLFTLGAEDLNSAQGAPCLHAQTLHRCALSPGIGVFLHMNASLSTPHTPGQSHQPNTKARRPPRCVNTVQHVTNHSNADLLLWWD